MTSRYRHTLGTTTYHFDSLAEVMAKASPARSGDRLAGVIAESAEERVVAQMVLAELPLKVFLEEALVPYEDDEITKTWFVVLDTDDQDKRALLAAEREHNQFDGFWTFDANIVDDILDRLEAFPATA